MATLTQCCCCLSIRTGSFVVGFYTLILYTGMILKAAFQSYDDIEINAEGERLIKEDNWTEQDIKTAAVVIIVLYVGCYILCSIASLIMLVGLCKDSPKLLSPWLIMIPVATFMDVALSLLYSPEEKRFAFLLASLFITALHVYCFLCVKSQYQEYKERSDRIPAVQDETVMVQKRDMLMI